MSDTASYFSPEELAEHAPVLFRCHSLAELMTDPKTKGEGVLSVGAKTHVKKLVKEALYGARARVDTKYMRKGLECEQTSIDLLNSIVELGLVKNTERRVNQFLTGEPDIVLPCGVDIKTSWSLETFPMLPEDGADKTYEWQARGYMYLFDKPSWTIAYCLVDTPDSLIGYEDPAVHKVSHIDPRMRVTMVEYQRDAELEDKIKVKCAAAQEYFKELCTSILTKRGVTKVFVGNPAPNQTDPKVAFA